MWPSQQVFGWIAGHFDPLADSFFAVFPALDGIHGCADRLANALEWHYKERRAGHFTNMLRDEYILDQLLELRKWLTDPRTQSLESDYLEPLEQAACGVVRSEPSDDDAETSELVQLLRDTAEEWELYTAELALRAFGPWGAFFFFQFHEYLCEEYWEYKPEHLQRVAELHSEFRFFDGVFVPTPLQNAILDALENRALKKEALAERVCGGRENGNILYRPGGLTELKVKEFVKLKRGVGFYRPDSPPAGTILTD